MIAGVDERDRMTDLTSSTGRVIRSLETLAFGSLLLAAAALPFEMTRPLFVAGPFAVTSVEAVLYLALFISVPTVLTRRTVHMTPAHWAVLAWGVANIISALRTPDPAWPAWKFTGRSLVGWLLFAVTAEIAMAQRRAAAVMAALAGGAVVSAVAGLLEVHLEASRPILAMFKTQPSIVGGHLRASGPFQYANTAAMFWEQALPMLIGSVVWVSAIVGRRILWWIGIAAGAVVSAAIAASLSRAGLLVSIMSLAGLALAARVRERRVSLAAGSSCAVLVALALLGPGGPLLSLRLTGSDEETWYRPEYRPQRSALELESGSRTTIPVTIRNMGQLAWPAHGPRQVLLAYHWERPGSPGLMLDGVRSPLSADVLPGGEVTVQANVEAPQRPGRYHLRWDMVIEQVVWFSMVGAPMGTTVVDVLPATQAASGRVDGPFARLPTVARPPRRELWTAALRLWADHPVTGVGPDNFRHRYGAALGFADFDDRIHANSLYLETLASLGAVGAAALMGLAAGLCLPLFRMARTCAGSSSGCPLILGVLFALASFFVHGLLDYSLEFTPTLGQFWLTAGLAAAIAGRATDQFT